MDRPPSKLAVLWGELRRRHVVRVSIGYVVVAVAVLQTADVVLPALSLPEMSMTVITISAIVGLPVMVALSWAYDITPFGVQKTAPLPVPDGMELGIGAPLGAPAPDDDRRSIAVLPFLDMSPDGDQEYFGGRYRGGADQPARPSADPARDSAHLEFFPSRVTTEICVRSAGGWASRPCSRAACERPVTICASPRSSSP